MARHRGPVKFPREWPIKSSHRTTQIIAHELGHAFAVAALGGEVKVITFGRQQYEQSPEFGGFTHGAVGQRFYLPHSTLQAAVSLAGPLAEDAFAGQDGTAGWNGDQKNFRRYSRAATAQPRARVIGATQPGAALWLAEHQFAAGFLNLSPGVEACMVDAYTIAATLVPLMGPFVAKWGAYLAEHRTKYISHKQSTIIDQMHVDARLAVPDWVKLDIGGFIADLKHDYLTSHIRAAVVAAEEKQKHD